MNILKKSKVSADTLKALALLLPLLLKISIAPVFAVNCFVVFSVTGTVQWLFASKRQHKTGIDWLFPAMLLCLLLPTSANIWQIALVAVFGTVTGEQIYGGRGYSFTSPVLVALALLFYSFELTSVTTVTPAAMQHVSLALIMVPLPVLLFYRLIDWQVLFAVVAAFFTLLVTNGNPAMALTTILNTVPTTAALCCIIYCTCDPLLCPRNTAGRVLYGLLVGGLLYLLDPSVALIEKTVFVSLLGTITSPLFDWLGSRVNSYSAAYETDNNHV